ncbi:hypothetical protein CEXT_468381, partial [Caerostris extrusa]
WKCTQHFSNEGSHKKRENIPPSAAASPLSPTKEHPAPNEIGIEPGNSNEWAGKRRASFKITPVQIKEGGGGAENDGDINRSRWADNKGVGRGSAGGKNRLNNSWSRPVVSGALCLNLYIT